MIRYFIKLLAAFEVTVLSNSRKAINLYKKVNQKSPTKNSGKNLINNLMNHDYWKCPFFADFQ